MIPVEGPIGDEEFAGWMAPLGPFEPAPVLGVAVSGGADSLCLALLADRWARARAGRVFALIVDHGLRGSSAGEAARTARLLNGRLLNGRSLNGWGIAARVLTLRDLHAGPALAVRARQARYGVLTMACAEAGIVHLLLGHHAADQAETVLIRALGQSGDDGMASMAALVETAGLRLLRPLLAQPPGRLRATLAAAGLAWIEDPSNADASALRPRLRLLRRDRDGAGSAGAALADAARQAAMRRIAREMARAAFMAEHVTLRPEGFAILPEGPIPADVLGALARMVSGSRYPPARVVVEAQAGDPRPGTFAGVRLMRWRGRLILLREARAMAPALPAVAGAVWDGRFRLRGAVPNGFSLGAVGANAPAFRRRSDLPAAVLATLPALRDGAGGIAVPHLADAGLSTFRNAGIGCAELRWHPANPASGAWFSA